jgi:type IV pilus assembly protein PilX
VNGSRFRTTLRGARAGGQRGVALLVALVMLIVIGLTSVSVMRGALSSDLVANNTRVQSLANQAAQIGLAYCERLLNDGTPSDGSTDMEKLHRTNAHQPAYFNDLANWTDDKVYTVPDSWMESADSSFAPDRPPECMVEQLDDTANGDKDFVVTARGFSPDYAADEDGNAESGSVVWLQSRVLYD